MIKASKCSFISGILKKIHSVRIYETNSWDMFEMLILAKADNPEKAHLGSIETKLRV